ncbi:protein FATTY ACID EXPORT 1, chloroplastic [Phoenix dactylifera]|uniref:Protein FATTY ACID EXPORT 1, chloroplastic n=1 Tax=Phoenix dactylifera TaxID=42345 RepID=A0A8B7C7D0_PHODC|nr:protein FATTY ACID EXPORT 1, chloroplastic [Phoenix dactylifera]XP_008793303.1 protein FATTY ACID EXPORT 1, chloroplastic [Phoenix dactylifera]
MVATQLSGAGLLVKRSLASLDGLCLSPLKSRVSSFNWVELNHRHFEGCVLRFPVTVTPKLSISMCVNARSTRNPGIDPDTSIKHSLEDHPEKLSDEPVKSFSSKELHDGKPEMDMHAQKEGSILHKQTAKIHDFCLGIPFGGFVFSGGLLGFIFSRNPASLTTGVLFGSAILALGVLSLKVWRKGQSSLPFILGQAAIAAALLGKHFRSYSLTKKLLPSGLYVFISAAMICFYSYVLIAGGNPPPKKLRAAPPTQL